MKPNKSLLLTPPSSHMKLICKQRLFGIAKYLQNHASVTGVTASNDYIPKIDSTATSCFDQDEIEQLHPGEISPSLA